MDRELEVVAKNETEAVEKALAEAGLEADDVETEVESLGKNSKGILGLMTAKENKYLVRISEKGEEEAAGETGTSEEIGSGSIREEAERLTRRVLELMGMSVDIEAVEEDEETVGIELEGEDSAILIGRRGQTLDALQYWINIAVHRLMESPKRVVVDVEEYRVRRASELESLARRTAERVIERGASIALRPMSAYERRIIHVTLQENEEVETISEGQEPERKVLVVPKD
jgi:spoIIIJ-associated protein